MLQLSRPIVFFDLETTGVNTNNDRIVEIALIKIMPDASKINKTYRINPTVPIPVSASNVHGIWDADVANEPTFKDLAGEIKNFIHDCDLAGYNSNRFDIPMLCEEFNRVGITIDLNNTKQVDVAQIFMKMEKRTLTAAYKFYCGKELTDAHSALADTEATYEVLLGQLSKYDELENNVAFLHSFSKGEDFADFSRRVKIVNGEKVFNFGKHKEKPVHEVFAKEPAYYDWIMKSDFAHDTKKIVTEIYTAMSLKKLTKN